MLVRFESEVGNLTMFGDVAVKLLKMMGHSGTVPSAIRPEDIPAALARLEHELEHGARAPGTAADEREQPVSLKRRAFPLIELLARAAKNDCEVMWQ